VVTPYFAIFTFAPKVFESLKLNEMARPIFPQRHRVHWNASPLVEVVARGGPEPPTFRFSVVWTIVRRINAHVATCTAALTEHQ
jgi:hypothetical protein